MTFAARDFWRRRGASDAHTLYGSVRSEPRSPRQKGLPPGGLRCFWLGASLRVGPSPTAGDAPSLRLAPSQKQRNERHRIYAHQHLGNTKRIFEACRPGALLVDVATTRRFHPVCPQSNVQPGSGWRVSEICPICGRILSGEIPKLA
jgi:hypothetical protein